MGDIHACVLNQNGAISAFGELTDVTNHVPTDTDFKQVCSGTYHCCGMHEDGRITCFGRNAYGEPVVRGTPTSAGHKDIICGNFHTCALQSDDKWNCWGQYWGDSAVFPSSAYPNVPAFRVREDACAGEGAGEAAEETCSVAGRLAVSNTKTL